MRFPKENVLVERYLGPVENIGPAMTAKILKANGEIVYRSTYRTLNEEEIRSDGMMAARETFTKSLEGNLGDGIMESEVEVTCYMGEGGWDSIGSNVIDEGSLPDRDDYDVDSFD